MSRQNTLLIFVALVAVIVAGRMMPHVPNFAPVAAAGLLAGFVFRSRLLAMAVPILGMLISDFLFVGTYNWQVMVFVYAGLTLPTLVGDLLKHRTVTAAGSPAWLAKGISALKLVGAATFASLFFFAVSNFGDWLFSGMYAQNAAGFGACYLAALPFLKSTMAADILFSASLFGAWNILLAISPKTKAILAQA